jgi:hypothetical protein
MMTCSLYSKAEKSYPSSWHILNQADRMKYRQLQLLMDTLTFRTNRKQVSMKFQVILSQIKQFAIRCDSDDWKRCFVCGIVWLDGAVAVNTRQLCVLVGKCKSSINAGFQAVGLANSVMSPSQALGLVQIFPFLALNSNEIRQWTIRENTAWMPACPPQSAMACAALPPCTKPIAFEMSMPELLPPCREECLATPPELEGFALSDWFDDSVDVAISYP